MISSLCVLAMLALPSADYPGAAAVPIGGEAVVLGQRQRMAYFTTNDAPAEVAERLVRRWRGQGFLAFAQREPSTGAHFAAAFCSATGAIVVVTAQRFAPGRTLALVGTRFLWDAAASGPRR